MIDKEIDEGPVPSPPQPHRGHWLRQLITTLLTDTLSLVFWFALLYGLAYWLHIASHVPELLR
jgi:predicted secreted protein